MIKVLIKCAKCGSDNWVSKKNPNPNIPKDLDKECGNCGVSYCAKNRTYDVIED